MNTQLATTNWNGLASGALGLVAILFMAAYLMNWKLPMISNDRAALYTLAVLGFAMCTISMGRTATALGWTHPITIAGIVLGVLILGLVIATAAGWRLPLIGTDRAALIALAVMGLAKWGLGIISRMFLHV